MCGYVGSGVYDYYIKSEMISYREKLYGGNHM